MTEPSALASTCRRCKAELEHGDLRCPVCALAIPVDRAAAERVQARIVRCSACGASLSWMAEAQAPKCAFCDSVMEIEIAKDPPEQAEHYLPFTVQPADARRALSAFLHRKSFFRPSDLATSASLDSLKALWWPGWIFTARALVSWTADSNVGAGRASWAPHSGSVHTSFDRIGISASRGLTASECAKLLPHYVLTSRQPAPSGPPNAQVERFDVNRSGARKMILEAIEREADACVRPKIPGSRVRNVHTAVLLEGLDTDRYALPAYVLAYRYRGELFRVVVHGQDAQQLLGRAPISPWKVLLAIAGGIAAAALLLALIGLFAAS